MGFHLLQIIFTIIGVSSGLRGQRIAIRTILVFQSCIAMCSFCLFVYDRARLRPKYLINYFGPMFDYFYGTLLYWWWIQSTVHTSNHRVNHSIDKWTNILTYRNWAYGGAYPDLAQWKVLNQATSYRNFPILFLDILYFPIERYRISSPADCYNSNRCFTRAEVCCGRYSKINNRP